MKTIIKLTAGATIIALIVILFYFDREIKTVEYQSTDSDFHDTLVETHDGQMIFIPDTGARYLAAKDGPISAPGISLDSIHLTIVAMESSDWNILLPPGTFNISYIDINGTMIFRNPTYCLFYCISNPLSDCPIRN